MIPVTAGDVATATNGRIISGEASVQGERICTDSRRVESADVFVALRGENFDAHDYLEQVVGNGATILIVGRPVDLVAERCSVVLCDDTFKGLQDLASWHRRQLAHPVIGITGSNGKTSTKDFTRSVMAQVHGVAGVNATLGNLNNHIGLPLSVLAASGDTKCSVLEMGMNHPGEIAPLCEICQPDIGIITNIGTAHIEYMGSREAIATEKGALGRSLSSAGTLVVPASCDFLDQLIEESPATAVVVGGDDSSIRAEAIRADTSQATFTLVMGNERAEVRLPVSGEHMVMNALLAAGAGSALGLSIQQIAAGLTQTSLTSGRMRAFVCDGIQIFDDTYNANPDSVAAALRSLAAMTLGDGATRYAVLGRMAELGDHAAVAYADLGALAAELGIVLVTIGDEGEAMALASQASAGITHQCRDIEATATQLKSIVRPGDAVLFKGSRAAGVERVMHAAFPESS